MGLQPFTEADGEYFFGRAREQRVISSNLYAAPLTVLYGPSGVGKSSILRAGVVPHLQSARRTTVVYFNQWQDAGFLHKLKLECLRAAEMREGRAVDVDAAMPLPEMLAALARASKGAWLILLDQFEEYFLYHSEDGSEPEFERQFASAINGGESELGFLIALRDDWLSRLDRFQGRIPNLLGNTYRLDHLSGAAAEKALREPLEVWNRKHGNGRRVVIEDGLVAAVLAQVRAGQFTLNEHEGTGQAKAAAKADRIEAAFLQLVMTRLWEEERKEWEKDDGGERGLHLATFERLGGARQIVQSHLENVLGNLSRSQQKACASMFRYLVTPTGAKIAHETGDLVAFAERPREEVRGLLERLSDPRTHLLRRIDQPERYEIFHDVLAPAVLDWRTRYVKAQEKAELEEKAEAQRRVAQRFRRLSVALALLGLLAAVVAGYAWRQRQAADAASRKAMVNERAAQVAEGRAVVEKNKAEEERTRADVQAKLAEASATEAEKAKTKAENEARVALAHQLAGAAFLSVRADNEASLLFAARAVSITRDADGTVLPDATEALRKAVGPEAIRLTLPGHSVAIDHLAFSPDGRRIATFAPLWDSNPNIRIWDVSTGAEVGGFSFFDRCSIEPGLVFSGDGTRLACADSDAFAVWDTRSGQELLRQSDFAGTRYNSGLPDRHIEQFALSPDGKWLIAGPHNSPVEVWDIAGQKLSKKFAGRAPALSPDGKRLATVGEKSIEIWETDTGRSLLHIAFAGDVAGLIFSPDGKRVAAATGQGPKVWDSFSGKEELTSTDQKGAVKQIAFTPDGRQLALAVAGPKVSMFDTATGKTEWSVQAASIGRFLFSPNGEVLICLPEKGNAGPVQLLETATGKSVSPKGTGPAAAFNPESSRLAISVENAVMIEDLKGDKNVTIWGKPSKVVASAISPKGETLAALDGHDKVFIWELSSGRRLLTLVCETSLHEIAYSPDARLIAASGGHGSGCVWDAASGRQLYIFHSDDADVLPGLAFSFDGKLIATGERRGMQIRDANSGAKLKFIHCGDAISAAFAPDGKHLVTLVETGKIRSIDSWDIATGEDNHLFGASSTFFTRITFNRDGKFLAAAPEALLVQDLASGSRPIVGQTQAKVLPDGMAFSSDGTILAAPLENDTVRLWNLSSHNEPSTFVQPAVAVGFSADDSFIYALTSQFEIYKYPWKLESVMAEATKKIRSRQLTDLQCKEYLHQETCPPEVSLPKEDGKNKAAR